MWLYCVPLFGCQLDARADAVAVALGAPQGDFQPMAGRSGFGSSRSQRLAERRHDYVDAAIAVEIAEGAAAMPGRRRLRPAQLLQ